MKVSLPRAAAAATAAMLLLSRYHAYAKNMNGDYKTANSETFSTDYGTTEFFVVYSPLIKTRYSEVFWRMQDPVPLPQSIKDRFQDKVMAVVGYEVDQVGESPTGNDVPIPITWAYNHHYCSWLISSKKAQLTKVKGHRVGHSHGSDEHWESIVTHDTNSDSGVPLSQFFSEGNGGEFRKSYHGYPKGYAQLIESPDTFHINPMQIDSWNRRMIGAYFMPGPLPRISEIPASAGYSGLIECPCSDRLAKEWAMTYALQKSGEDCMAPIQNASECFSAAKQVVQAETFAEKQISDSSSPPGCFIEPRADGSADTVWNFGEGSPDAPLVAKEKSRVVAFARGQVNVTVELSPDSGATITMVGPSDKWFGVGFGSDSMCIHSEGDECPTGGPYAIIVSRKEIMERKLDFHGPGTLLDPSVTIKSSMVKNGVQSVVLTRTLKGASSDHYSFDVSTSSVPIITATGCSFVFAKHCGHGPAQLNFLVVDTPTGVCQAGISGSIGGNKFNNKRCEPFPTSDLKTQNNPTCHVQTYRGGLSCCRDGQSLLDKDQEIPWADQYLEYRLKFRFYFEEYKAASTELKAPSHQDLVRVYWQTEGHVGEYDIVQCEDGVPLSQCVQVITSRWKVRDMLHDCSTRPDAGFCTGKGSTDTNLTQGIELIYAGPHCHAPSCLSMELYNADTGRLLCSVEPMHGNGHGIYDEHGFVAIPPCLWGDESEGLQKPELLSLDTNLLSIKRNNNTLGHTGEMAYWQMRAVVIPKTQFIFNEASATNVRRGRLRRTEDGRE